MNADGKMHEELKQWALHNWVVRGRGPHPHVLPALRYQPARSWLLSCENIHASKLCSVLHFISAYILSDACCMTTCSEKNETVYINHITTPINSTADIAVSTRGGGLGCTRARGVAPPSDCTLTMAPSPSSRLTTSTLLPAQAECRRLLPSLVVFKIISFRSCTTLM